MDSQDTLAILKSIRDDKESQYLYFAAQKLVDEARSPRDYQHFKLSWKGEVKKEFEQSLKLLKEYGWHEPVSK